ncbi:hypothetical protein H2199_004457 [Coniosporium tulheliwenetii]|uniref:Uncharacterized protein n=1 Tax=Coniosporium tulheliwenetii TaxID=3383036 RepID=A0ACC2Z6N8_9PEZI|nr:hypothetical protein H2199_004457 [Cladosporium sp. JES 115]
MSLLMETPVSSKSDPPVNIPISRCSSALSKLDLKQKESPMKNRLSSAANPSLLDDPRENFDQPRGPPNSPVTPARSVGFGDPHETTVYSAESAASSSSAATGDPSTESVAVSSPSLPASLIPTPPPMNWTPMTSGTARVADFRVHELYDGGQGLIELTQHLPTRSLFVVKTPRLAINLTYERRMLCTISSHPHIVHFLGIWGAEDFKTRRRGLEENIVWHVLAQLGDAVHWLHCGLQQPIVHCDIKPDNILLEPQPGQVPDLRLTDFGLAKFAAESGQRTGHRPLGTPIWQPADEFRDTCAADVWAVGAVVHWMTTGHPPVRPYVEVAGLSEEEQRRSEWLWDSFSERVIETITAPRVPGDTAERVYSETMEYWMKLALRKERSSRVSAKTLYEGVTVKWYRQTNGGKTAFPVPDEWFPKPVFEDQDAVETDGGIDAPHVAIDG